MPLDDGPTTRAEARLALRFGEQQKILLSCSRFSSKTKADLFPLLIAFKKIAEQEPDAVLLLIGDDTECKATDHLREYAQACGLEDRVYIWPNLEESVKIQALLSADVFVALSDNLQETYGISVAEAMMAGLPAVVADWDGYKDLVSHGETGFRVRTILPRYGGSLHGLDGPGALFQSDLLAATTIVDLSQLISSVTFLLGNAAERRRMGLQARAKALAQLSWQRVISKYEMLWREMVSQP
jgi:glycosyltransferase involved in cell wall biosynthesis